MEKEKKKRGFASMTLEKRREISKMGGISAHQQGVAHKWTNEEAKVAGSKGGLASRKSRNPQLDELERTEKEEEK